MKHIKSIILLLIIILSVFLVWNHTGLTDKLQSNFNKYYGMFKSGNLIDLEGYGNLIGVEDLSSLEDSHVDYSNYKFDSTYNYYYGLLSNDGKELYRQVYANASKLKKSFVPKVSINYKDIDIVMNALYNDNPELFYLDNSYSYRYISSGRCVHITLKYNDLINNLDANKSKFNNSINNIVRGANKYKSIYDKEKYVHDTLIRKIRYDKNSKYNQSAYSALVNNSSVCAGYSKAFQLIMNKLGMPTYYVTGYAGENHAWNIIKLGNGYYNVDLTWDDGRSISYNYFNVTDSKMSDHSRSDLSKYLPKCNSTTYAYNSNNYKKKTKPVQTKKPIYTPKPEVSEDVVVEETPSTEEEILEEDIIEDEAQ